MGILSYRELPRTVNRRFGERFVASRQWVLTLDDTGATASTAATTVGVDIGSAHPEFPIYCGDVTYNESYEGSRYHSLFVAEYGGDVATDPSQYLTPVLRPAVWSFQTQGTTVPALYYYSGSGNGTQLPLTNSAFDYFEGLTTDEAQCKIVIKENRATFPSSIAIALTNTINASPWIGAPAHSWKCQGITGELRHEIWAEQLVRFWEVTVELLYRQTGWPLQLPDVGFNYVSGGQKRRAVVFDFENSEWVASPGPVGLNGSGGLANGAPAILPRRVHREVEFNSYFANPPA